MSPCPGTGGPGRGPGCSSTRAGCSTSRSRPPRSGTGWRSPAWRGQSSTPALLPETSPTDSTSSTRRAGSSWSTGTNSGTASSSTPVYEHPVEHDDGMYFLDLAFQSPRLVAVECIGKIGHDFERAFETDPVRRNRLQLLGWIVIEVTWRRFVNAPEEVVAEVRQSL